jgi:two-component system LytT family response regulator
MQDAEWRVLIADDEPAARRGVRQLLAPFPQFCVVGECTDGGEVLAALDVLKPDAIFLDVQMPGIDGFEVIRRRTPERMPAVVFLTAYDQFAIRAFEAQALDYLMKPPTEARFAATIKRLSHQLSVITAASASSVEDPVIVTTTARGTTVQPLREIDWIEAADNYARIWTGQNSCLVRESLRDLESRVRAHGFARAHRGALIRLSGVRQLTTTRDGGVVAILASGAKIRVSRRRRAAFASAVKQQVAS